MDIVVGLLLDLYVPQQNCPVRPWVWRQVCVWRPARGYKGQREDLEVSRGPGYQPEGLVGQSEHLEASQSLF